MGTNAVFANKGDGQHTGMTGKAGPGTNSVRILTSLRREGE